MTQRSPLLLAIAVPFILDAAYGIQVLKTVFGKQEMHGDDLLEQKSVFNKEFNDRVPEILT
jgi:hypothetical protein